MKRVRVIYLCLLSLAPLLNFIFASAQADEQFMTDVILHKLVAESLLDCGVSGAVREAILSIAGIEEEPHLAMHFRHLPAIVSKAVSSLICLSRTLSGSQEAFGAALSACQENWKRLGESLEAADGSFLRGEDVAAAAQYTSHLLEFRKLWLRLFGPSYASSGKEEVPPHMFAVNWGKVKSVESVKWMQDAERGSSCVLTEIISGKAPVFTYFLYILQHTLVVRVKLLHCLAEIFENTARCVNIMEVVRHVHVARAVQQDMRRQQELWERLGLLTLQMREGPKHCHNHELQFFCNFPCVQRVDLTKGKDAPLPPLFYTQCPFIWILLGTLWDMEDRISLIFSRSLIILPSSKLSRACASVKIDSPGASGRGSLAGRSMLVNEICTSSGLTCTHEPDYADQMRREGGADARLSLLSSGVMEEEARSCRLAQPSGGFASRGVLSLIFSPWRKVLSRPADREQVDMRVPELTPPFGLDLTPCQETNLDFVAIQGCRCLSQHILNITEGYNGATLLVATNCKQRPGKRVWYNNQYTFGATTFSDASFLDGEGAIEASEASELQHWVLNFVFPKSRLSEERGQRMRQEFALLRSVALQSVGSTGHRLQFEGDKGSRFFVLRSYENMDEGRLYFALLLPFCSTKPNSTVEVSRWAFSLMESLCATWCMPNLTNLAVQLAVCGT
uniref:Uncharacterized protein n=1 Tax=Trypanosoma congolense (strain IL3000) TaxID=1068625 RepID=G0UUH4_TRYCI|nr:conserved hypothetical protein [Trypanosoma congolense IL3000]